jgi:ATP/maltotriose-dependent transcriptional regulator MalT
MAQQSNVSWPEIDRGYADEFGPIDVRVYGHAGKLWPLAERLALRTLGDTATGLRLLLKASALVSRVLQPEPQAIERPGAYLMVTFKRLLMAEKKTVDDHRRIENFCAISVEQDDSYRDLDRRIFATELLNRVPANERQILELLALGYSLTEIGRRVNQKPGTLRARLRRLVKTTASARAESRVRAARR